MLYYVCALIEKIEFLKGERSEIFCQYKYLGRAGTIHKFSNCEKLKSLENYSI